MQGKGEGRQGGDVLAVHRAGTAAGGRIVLPLLAAVAALAVRLCQD
ncbi:hypothetical protein K353_03438 [Kitasatospora sp. SolWspMP-SS2h]|nr:hypothetical protein [Kitasatospora sp. SolWspMP-SS2h]RAJ40546.1 hypothetical protein K353_03438 [Kitasatospora sp. SolWspMP-SS2h]